MAFYLGQISPQLVLVLVFGQKHSPINMHTGLEVKKVELQVAVKATSKKSQQSQLCTCKQLYYLHLFCFVISLIHAFKSH